MARGGVISKVSHNSAQHTNMSVRPRSDKIFAVLVGETIASFASASRIETGKATPEFRVPITASNSESPMSFAAAAVPTAGVASSSSATSERVKPSEIKRGWASSKASSAPSLRAIPCCDCGPESGVRVPILMGMDEGCGAGTVGLQAARPRMRVEAFEFDPRLLGGEGPAGLHLERIALPFPGQGLEFHFCFTPHPFVQTLCSKCGQLEFCLSWPNRHPVGPGRMFNQLACSGV